MSGILNLVIENLIAPAIMLLVGYWIGRPKAKADAESVEEQTQGTELENVTKALTIYRSIVEDLNNKMRELQQRAAELESVIERLEAENKSLKEKLNQ